MDDCKLIWPDYNNCLANVPNSILKYFGVEPVGPTLPLLDKYLDKEYKNVVLLLLDGMGKSIIEKHLEEDGTFRSNVAGIYQSVFLSTTVAATTSALSGLQPCEHSWLGWECYYPQIDKNVTVFTNCEQGTKKQAADYNVAFTYTPYENTIKKINNVGGQAYAVSPFFPPNPKSIKGICRRIRKLCAEPGRKYIYAYWGQPDGLLHRNGCSSKVVTSELRSIEQCVTKMMSDLKDTLVIVTADHGHIDNDYACLEDYPKITDCLTRLPSLEPRVINFFVKEGRHEEFTREFNKEFGDHFILMTVDEAIEKNLFGTGEHHPNFRGMLGDYLAIATGHFSVFFNEERWRAMHGSVTEEEMLIPLITLESPESE